ncbi:hypothetical protein [Paenibacillus xylanexedens]|uniref:hypothetical protein n=1 Tax=Paenibacillus xylanexedens TaxID=528191 RepID=UPI0011A43A15|nr:hypothetical protein [Paenibacillus xylanexedens]
MIKVTCIDNREAEDFLTEGSQYLATESDGDEITIQSDDNGKEFTTLAARFSLFIEPKTKPEDPQKVYAVDVSWLMKKTLQITAKSDDEARDKAREWERNLTGTPSGEYSEDSFEVEHVALTEPPHQMKLFEAIYGMGDIGTGGYYKSLVAADHKDSVTGLLCEHHAEDVIISRIDLTKRLVESEHEHVISTVRV